MSPNAAGWTKPMRARRALDPVAAMRCEAQVVRLQRDVVQAGLQLAAGQLQVMLQDRAGQIGIA